MKTLLIGFAIVLATASIGTPAQAQNYPWCADYGDGFGGTNCGFVSYAQCMDTIRGMGGFCNQNTMYQPPAGASATRKARKRPANNS